jgi:hypothetical protein
MMSPLGEFRRPFLVGDVAHHRSPSSADMQTREALRTYIWVIRKYKDKELYSMVQRSYENYPVDDTWKS